MSENTFPFDHVVRMASLTFDLPFGGHGCDAVTTGQMCRTLFTRDPLPADNSGFISPLTLNPKVSLWRTQGVVVVLNRRRIGCHAKSKGFV